MRLYKIESKHFAPRDSHQAIETWAIARSDKHVLAVLTMPHKRDHPWPTTWWGDSEEVHEVCDDGYNLIGTETHMERMLRLRGDMNDPDAPVEDAYYGVTLYGWDEGADISGEDAETLIRLGVAVDWRGVADDA